MSTTYIPKLSTIIENISELKISIVAPFQKDKLSSNTPIGIIFEESENCRNLRKIKKVNKPTRAISHKSFKTLFNEE